MIRARFTRASRPLLALGLVALFGGTARADTPPLLEVLTGFSGKEVCSCVFAVQQSDTYCEAFGQIGGLNVAVAIDRGTRSVTTTFQGISRVARADATGACVLDP